MLTDITIQNFAIIEQLAVEFDSGMTVFSGETGAGKSILVDALGLILGARADTSVIREGAERADITARFVISDAPAARDWLAANDLETGDECVIRRVVASTGRSRSWINGTPTPVRSVRELGDLLVDIHGQHAHQKLLRRDRQRLILDEYGQHESALAKVSQAAEALQTTRAAITRIEQRNDQGQSRLELLRYQVDELQTLAVMPDEVEALEAEHKRLASAERLIENGHQALGLLHDQEESAAADQLGTAGRLLEDLAETDPDFAPLGELVNNALIQVREATDGLRQHVDSLDIDPQRFTEVENRLGAIQDVARKHQVSPETLPALTDRLTRELAELEGADEKLSRLKIEQQQQHEAYRAAAQELSQARLASARALEESVTDIIQTLGMPEGECRVRVRANASERISASGTDHVEFLFAANPGQTVQPLDRVASGGELSRLSLAIEVIAVANSRIPTMVFDEVDTGIGGGVAEIVGRQLSALGANGQSLCVTHLPQVAAQAEQHLHVAKQVQNGHTKTRITPLDREARIEELARMLGGIELTQQTRAHAADMLEQAAK